MTNCAVMMGSVMLKSKSAPDSAMEDPATIALPRTVVTMTFEDVEVVTALIALETEGFDTATFEEEEDEHRTEQDRETFGALEESLSVDIIVVGESMGVDDSYCRGREKLFRCRLCCSGPLVYHRDVLV